MGDPYESIGNLDQALESYDTAITWLTDEGIPATANKVRLKAGQIAAKKGDYYKAVSLFVKGAEESLKTGPTGRFIVKSYLFKAGSKFSRSSGKTVY